MKSMLLIATTILLSISVMAQDATPTVPTTQFSGFVDIDFAWNDNRPDNHENFYPGIGTTAKRANEFAINLAQVQWTRPVSQEQPVGFTLALVAGEGTDVVHAGEPGGPGKFRHLYQASLAYRLQNGVVVEGGVYPTHIGMEGFYSKDNWNYTRTVIGESAQPYYQTGIKASYAFNDHWSGRVDVMNGWQLINDNNDGKSIGTQLAYTSDKLSASLNTFLGPELAGDDDSLRKLVDVVAVYKATPSLQVGGTVDFGSQELPGGGSGDWNGAGVYARYAVSARSAVAIRAERLDDPDNGIIGTAQTIREATLTFEHRPTDNLILKLEARHDRSTEPVFKKDANDFSKTQTLVVFGAVVTF
jgi:hypothetical protein